MVASRSILFNLYAHEHIGIADSMSSAHAHLLVPLFDRSSMSGFAKACSTDVCMHACTPVSTHVYTTSALFFIDEFPLLGSME